MALTPQDIAKKLSPSEFMAICDKVVGQYNQMFAVLSVHKSGQTITMDVELENGQKKTVVM